MFKINSLPKFKISIKNSTFSFSPNLGFFLQPPTFFLSQSISKPYFTFSSKATPSSLFLLNRPTKRLSYSTNSSLQKSMNTKPAEPASQHSSLNTPPQYDYVDSNENADGYVSIKVDASSLPSNISNPTNTLNRSGSKDILSKFKNIFAAKNPSNLSPLISGFRVTTSDYSSISYNQNPPSPKNNEMLSSVSSTDSQGSSTTNLNILGSSNKPLPVGSKPKTFDPKDQKKGRDSYASAEEMEISKKNTTFATWKKLIKLAKSEYKYLGGAIGLLLVSSSVTMSVPLLMGKIIDIVTNPSTTIPFGLTLNQIFGGLTVFFTLGAFANFGRVYLIRMSGESIIARLRTNLYKKMVLQDMTFFETNRSGDLVSRLTVDTTIVSKSITTNLSDGMRSIVSLVTGLPLMVYMSPKLSLVVMMIIPVISTYAVVYGKFVKKITQKTQTAIGDITKESEERLSNIRIVQAFGRENEEVISFRNASNHVFDLGKKEAFASGIFFGSNGFLGNISILLFLSFGGRMVLNGEISIGDLSSFMLYAAYVGASLAGVTTFFSESMKGIGASNRLFYILERPPKISISSNSGQFFGPIEQGGIGECKGQIQFENVCFSYPSRPDVQIFNNMSLDIKAGSHIAIAGPSGKGKSTITWLLLRMYDINSGSIKIDGHDLKDLNLQKWRSNVAIVPQEPTLFATTIRQNLLYANPNATDEEIMKVLAYANAAEFVNNFPKKLDTFAGERGVSLSGGQKQRIAIARALLLNPSVLILDEATSALDSQSEKSVQDALNKLINGTSESNVLADSSMQTADDIRSSFQQFKLNCTVITIAHRQSTLEKSDIIYVLGDDGQIVETGSYNDLIAKNNGYFKHLMDTMKQ
ncbi:hypothetical protein BB561_005981 [Smittium simulii]|uniref:Uncharacterized protein n=1 Tax=Smittium simulii TaxID=133385 RepID=A0A2T9Y776_9FUNG|nr:hypothetical protein BB561_005981 [Smittium simulii]